MIYKCPNCNGALEYNPVSDEMECAHCGGGYTVAEMEASRKKVEYSYDCKTGSTDVLMEGSVAKNETADSESDTSEDANHFLEGMGTMECRIYTCTSCGAELVINENEAASFCAYCGQPTVVFSRVSNELKPESIIPFKISQEQAVGLLRERLKKSYFIPKEVKDVKMENIKGIYIPYWLFDVYYYDIQYWEVNPQRAKTKDDKPLIYSREAECNLRALTVDASDNLDDETSQRLEPYNLRDRKPFDSAYLSGYYADKYDLGDQELYDFAVARAKEIFDTEIRKTIPERTVEMISSLPKRRVDKAEYTMLPAWFLTFRYQNEPYTMVINGQTGKVVGTLPYDRNKIILLFIIVSVITGILAFIPGIFMANGVISLVVLMALAIFVPLVELIIAIPIFSKIKKTGKLTRARKTARFARERQDRD